MDVMKHYSRLRRHDPDGPVGPDTGEVGAKYEPHVGESKPTVIAEQAEPP